MNNDSPNDWLKFWSENQKTLFQAWVEGKPPGRLLRCWSAELPLTLTLSPEGRGDARPRMVPHRPLSPLGRGSG